MTSIIFECDNGIWFNEEDPNDILYNPTYIRNVYLDLISGKLNDTNYDEYQFKSKKKSKNKSKIYK